jgi:hypothetical protein
VIGEEAFRGHDAFAMALYYLADAAAFQDPEDAPHRSIAGGGGA